MMFVDPYDPIENELHDIQTTSSEQINCSSAPPCQSSSHTIFSFDKQSILYEQTDTREFQRSRAYTH